MPSQMILGVKKEIVSHFFKNRLKASLNEATLVTIYFMMQYCTK